MTTMKSMWRLSPEERRHDWYKRHHRLAENLFAAPLGALTPLEPHAPHLDGFCAPKNAHGMIGWAEPWNHSAWVLRDWVRLADTGRSWPDETPLSDCPICLGPCGYTVELVEGRPDPRIDRVEYVPWAALTESMQLFLSEKQGLPWSRRDDESLLEYTARHFRLTKLVGYDVGQAPVAFTLRISDGARSRCLVAGVPFNGSSRLECLAVTETAMEALLYRMEQLGPAGPHELDADDLERRLLAT
jgi:hypothetical protein